MSELKMIRDVSIAIESTSIGIAETEWTPGTYPDKTRRYIGTDLYEAATETSDNPIGGAAKDPPTWVKIGKINRWRMFSEAIAEQSVDDGPIEVILSVPPDTNSIAFFGVDGASIVNVTTYNEERETGTYPLGFNNFNESSDWYDYFFAPVEESREVSTFNLPGYGTTRIKIVFEGPGEIRVGKIVVGNQFVIGRTKLATRAGFVDFSLKERDEFGGFKITERRYARTAILPAFVDANRQAAVLDALAEVRARPTVYVGDENSPETIIVGFFKDVQILRVTHLHAEIDLEVEAVT